MSRRAYPSVLTGAQWQRIAPLVPAPTPGGRPARISRPELVNACVCVVRNGVIWRALPHDLPKWQTTYYSFTQWSTDGPRERIHESLRDAARVADGRDPSPSAAVIDAQSVKTAEHVGVICGDDAGKQVKGRKRHLAVDMLGLGCPLGDGDRGDPSQSVCSRRRQTGGVAVAGALFAAEQTLC